METKVAAIVLIDKRVETLEREDSIVDLRDYGSYVGMLTPKGLGLASSAMGFRPADIAADPEAVTWDLSEAQGTFALDWAEALTGKLKDFGWDGDWEYRNLTDAELEGALWRRDPEAGPEAFD